MSSSPGNAWDCRFAAALADVAGESRRWIEAENLLLRHQVNILRRPPSRRLRLSNADRLAFVWLYRLCPSVVDAVAIIKPETLIRWHRRGFKAFWRWKSRSRGGRPAIPREIRDVIREMSRANGLWGAPRIHGELLKLGIEVAQSTVAKYLIKRPQRPGQSWATFLRNHADSIAAADLFKVSARTVAKYMRVRHDLEPSPGWRNFLKRHATRSSWKWKPSRF